MWEAGPEVALQGRIWGGLAQAPDIPTMSLPSHFAGLKALSSMRSILRYYKNLGVAVAPPCHLVRGLVSAGAPQGSPA